MTTLATVLFPQELDVLLVFAARANDAINAGEVRYHNSAVFAATVAALRSRLPSLDGITIFPDIMSIVATRPACKSLYNMLCAGGDTSFDAAIQQMTSAISNTFNMFYKRSDEWRTHPAFAGREHEWDFLGTNYIVLDWLVADDPSRLKCTDVRNGQSKVPEICTTGAAARPLADGGLAFIMPCGHGRLALVCPRHYLKILHTHYSRSIIAATMLIARLGFLSRDSGFCLDRSGALAHGLLTLIERCRAAKFDVPESLHQAMSSYCTAHRDSIDSASQTQLRSRCIQALLDYSRPWLHEEDSDLASLFRGWMVTVGPGTLVDCDAIVCPGATLSANCTIGASAIVRNLAWVGPYAVIEAGQIVTSRGSIVNAGANDVSSDAVPVRSRVGGPGSLLPAPYENPSLPRDDTAIPFDIPEAPDGFHDYSPAMTRESGSRPLWRYPVAGDSHRGGTELGEQNTTAHSHLSTTTTTTAATMPPLSRTRPRPIAETRRDNAPRPSRQRTAQPRWPASGANAWPRPESTQTRPQQFLWIQDPGAMPTRQMSRPPAQPLSATYSATHLATNSATYSPTYATCDAPPAPTQDVRAWPQNLEPETPLPAALPPLWSAPAGSDTNPPSNYPERPDSGSRIDTTPPFVHNRASAFRQAPPTMERVFLPNDILDLARLPPPSTPAPAPVLYSGRGSSQASPDDDAPRAASPQPSPTPHESPLPASGIGRSPAMPRPASIHSTFKQV